MLGMQGSFPQVPMPVPMANFAPMHPMEDPAEQEMMTEVLNIAKIKEGFYIGDKISAISIDVIIQFKITHMINATGNQIMNQWESIGISYLTLNWSETPSQILFDSKDEIANRIVEFVDGSLLGKGEGLLAHSFKGQNRVCIVVLIYLMKKYKWGLNKSMQFLKSKKQDVDIPIYFLEQLKHFEMRLKSRKELNNTDIPWEFEGLKDPEEKLLRNTYLNGVKIELKNDENNINKNKGNRHIMWADNNPYQKTPIEINNNENDLFFQTNIKPITVHQSLKPRKGCIKNSTNNSINNNININNNVKNMEIAMENNFANLIKKGINLSNNLIGEQNVRNINEQRDQINNLKIINNNFYQNNNINIINNGKINNMNMNINMSTNNNPNNIKNLMNKEMINNFIDGNNINNNIQDMRVNNSVNIPKTSFNINTLNSNIINNNFNMPFRNDIKNTNNLINSANNNNIKTNKNNNNVSPFRSNNNMNNNRQNILVGNNNNNNVKNNNYIKNPNMSNTQQNFYKEKQFNNIMNYTPLIKERNIRENNNTNSSKINNNKGIFSQHQNQISNYNAIRGFNNSNNFNKNIRNNNKPLNNYNPNLIKHKGIQHNDSSLLKANKNGGPVKIKNNNYINNLNKKPNTPDLNHYNYNSGGFNMDNNQNPNRFKYNTNNISTNNKKDFKNDTMANGWGYSSKNNFNRKIVPPRPSTAPQKDKNIIHNPNSISMNNNKLNNLNRSNQFANNMNNNKIGRYNQRPSSAGGKSQNQGYGYVNNMNRSGVKNMAKNKNVKKNNLNTGINKRLASPQIYNNGIGFNNNNNQNNIRNKFNPAKHRMPSPVIKSNIGKRPLIGNNGQRLHMNKSEKFN